MGRYLWYKHRGVMKQFASLETIWNSSTDMITQTKLDADIAKYPKTKELIDMMWAFNSDTRLKMKSITRNMNLIPFYISKYGKLLDEELANYEKYKNKQYENELKNYVVGDTLENDIQNYDMYLSTRTTATTGINVPETIYKNISFNTIEEMVYNKLKTKIFNMVWR